MTPRTFALVIPAVLGIACSHASKELAAQDHTGAMWTQREKEAQEAMLSENRTASMTSEDAVAAAQGTGSQGESTTGSPSTGGSSGSSGMQEPAAPQGSPGGSDSGSAAGGMGQSGMGQSDSGSGPSGMGTPSGGMGSDGGATASTAKKGAAHKVSGKLSDVSSDSVTITPKKGEAHTLKISPETKVTMNGKSVQPSELKQGQQVRASYDAANGEETATHIWAGKAGAHARSGKGSSTGGTGGMGSDTGSSGGSMSK